MGADAGQEPASYSGSAEGILISRERAFEELARHGLHDPASREEFLGDCGDHATYDAGDVLRWLGY
ncbi:hypothetical protein HOY34_07510 [Xinfangfangia sp. D13-10-4-6]|uniref:hypothetical protein n=1 Tax=Pseudogemmobacter hezensis TaxID=2737662 RepID=UPI0015557511|nr:hypothetical protein [Pseudogemmobacter hezensis]NPD15050.1 hypothetical protein [Pseudogemmobacter hezensis]